jgi:serine/threonine protein phosphatase 1
MGRILAISDIHGCFDTFHKLVSEEISLTRSDRLILLGDYVDRGTQSKQVIDFIIELMEKGFNITPLRGNHEEMLIDAWENLRMLPLWLINDGMSTLQSFGIEDIRKLEKKYLNFFLSLKYYEKFDNFLFVHAGFNDLAPDPFSDIHGMIWESHPAYNNQLLEGYRIIHGHRPKTVEYIQKLISGGSRVIPVDSGCVYDKHEGYGVLSALDVGNMKLISVENIRY